jgi:predicted dehydrogenase
VLVETRVPDLLDNAEACVAAGMHVHIDKPPGDSLPRLRRLLEAASAKKLLVQPGYMFRYSPAVVLLREFLAKGWLGDVFEVHAVMSRVIDPPVRKELAAFRGGIMFELGCHVVDLVVGILGRPDGVTAYARHSSRLEDGLADNCLAVLDYPKATATVRSSALEVQGFDRRHLTVCGTGGTFHIQPLDNPTAKITLAEDRDGYRKGTQEVRFPKYVRYVGDAADMARIIRGEKTPDFGADHELAVQETLLGACGMAEK